MENLSYIFRAGHRAISPILLLLALLFSNYTFGQPGSIADSTASEEEAPKNYTIKASDGKGGGYFDEDQGYKIE